jgi:hypothetical protein
MLELVWHPVGLAQPDRAAAQGQPATELLRALPGSAPGLPRGSPWGRSAGCHTLPTPPSLDDLCPGHPGGSCPPGEGTVLLQVDKIFWGPSKAQVYAAGAMLTSGDIRPGARAAGRTCMWFRARESRPCQVAPADQQV